MFSMREDGFEFDRFLATKQQNAMKGKNTEPGPPASSLARQASSMHYNPVTLSDAALMEVLYKAG